jgi:hypothetical protein
MANGFAPTVAVLGCGDFNFENLVNASDVTLNLPVLFSSSQYRSLTLDETIAGRIYPKITIGGVAVPVDEYWFGQNPWIVNSLCARSGSKVYYFHIDNTNPANNIWKEWVLGSSVSTFKSVPDVRISYFIGANNPPDYLFVNTSTTTLGLGKLTNVTLCQISGDGMFIYARTSVSWYTYASSTGWVALAAFEPTSLLVPSFNGNTLVATVPALNTFRYKIGTAPIQTKTLSSGFAELHAACLTNMIFVVQGSRIYTVGSLNEVQLVKTMDTSSGDATGIWADARTVWVSTSIDTYMSNDTGWTWTKLAQQRAVGPGLFTKTGSSSVWRNSEDTFAQTVQFPLSLSNGGRLFNTQWSNWFQDSLTNNDELTTITPTTTWALSTNGRYLYRNDNGAITLYLNVWNAPTLTTYCGQAGSSCQAGRARYCQQFGSLDARCSATPDDEEPPVIPTPPKTSGMPTWAKFLLGVVLPLLLVGGVLWFVFRGKSDDDSSSSSDSSESSAPTVASGGDSTST